MVLACDWWGKKNISISLSCHLRAYWYLSNLENHYIITPHQGYTMDPQMDGRGLPS